MNKAKQLIDRLEAQHSLSIEEYEYLIENQSDELAAYAAEKAVALRKQVYGTDVYIRGLIEIGNICRNDCYYCGIRRSNPACDRYRLTEAQILDCAREGYALGFRTFVMQGGEDSAFSVDVVCHLVRQIKAEFPDCAVTLSLGEFPREAYQAMFDAGADRYLLRHETADQAHYEKLHPAQMSFDNRMRCLRDLKDIGYQTGCGFMVGSPYQTARTLAEDLKFIEEFRPEMCGIAERHTVPRFSGRNVRADGVSAVTAAADPAEFAAAGHNGARHHPAGRPRARTAGWCKRSDAQSVSAWGAKKICTVRRQTMYRRGGCTVHRLPVAPCGVGRLPDCYRTRRYYPISDTF